MFNLLPHELIVDNFAGGGGTSTGLERAFGRPIDIAIRVKLFIKTSKCIKYFKFLKKDF